MSLPYILQGSNIVVVVDNKPVCVGPAHPFYSSIRSAIQAGDWDTVRSQVNPVAKVVEYAKGNLVYDNGKFTWKGLALPGALTRRMVAMLQEGFDIEPMRLFVENLLENPSHRAVEELYTFLEANQLPITPDGYFLAYKKVRDDYLDVYSGTISNRVGREVSMPRWQVNDNKEETCSAGLHFCSQEYLNSFSGDRTMILKINPRDVVSIPIDYNNSKGRCCRYLVVGELGIDPAAAFTQSVQSNAHGVINSISTTAKPKRQLSMTKDAIRKREARARAKAAQASKK